MPLKCVLAYHFEIAFKFFFEAFRTVRENIKFRYLRKPKATLNKILTQNYTQNC